jgi:CRP/FNR family cyclic AMP-dependent transcriptional regulator
VFTIASFKQCIRSVLSAESSVPTRRIAKRCNVYAVGSRDDQVYFITEGQVKVMTQSQAGRECLLAIYTAGDFFGECCLCGIQRSETAVAMSDIVLKQVTGVRFLALMVQAGLMGDFVRYLAARLLEQQQVITNLATVDCEYRLAAALLRLSRKLGACEGGGLAQRISHQELSQMVGTMRPRISEFMQRFRDRGLIDMTPDSRILVRERRLQEYLETRELEPRLSAAAAAK